jgi:hypothetical protein
MEPIATVETARATLAVAAGLVRLLIVATTGTTPDELLLAAAVWTAAFTLAGGPVGLLLARGLRSGEPARGPGGGAARPAQTPALDPACR